MFVYKFEKSEAHIFEDNQLPLLARISQSKDDYQWTSPIDLHDDKLEIAFIEKVYCLMRCSAGSTCNAK